MHHCFAKQLKLSRSKYCAGVRRLAWMPCDAHRKVHIAGVCSTNLINLFSETEING